jgi:hypothetical protein
VPVTSLRRYIAHEYTFKHPVAFTYDITSTRKGTVTREGKPHHGKNKTHEEEQGGLKTHTTKRDEWRTLEGRSKEEHSRKKF